MEEDVKQEMQVRHEYVIGTLNQIKKGDFGDNFPKTFDLDEAKLLFPENFSKSSLILIPNIIGAYRRYVINANLGGEGSPQEIRFDLGTRLEFEVNPCLVQVGYNPQEFEREVILDFFGSERNRIKIVPYQELTNESKEFDKYSRLITQLFTNRMNGKSLTHEEMKESADLVKIIIKTDGLTKPEHDILYCYNRI